MINNQILELANLCNGELINYNQENENFDSICIDTRKMNRNSVFIPLTGKNFDGHDFVDEAFNKGALAAIVKKDFKGKNKNLIKVKDTLEALQVIAFSNRCNWNGVCIGITGSAGKTTVKELCHHIVSTTYSSHKNFGNFNNHIGLPITLIDLNESHKYLIAEIGMNQPGEIKFLSNFLQPEISIITEIGLAHAENFNSLEDIAYEKSAIIRNLTTKNTSILDIDSSWYSFLKKQTQSKILSVSLNNNGSINGLYNGDDKLKVEGYNYQLPIPGRFMARNILKSIALGKFLGIDNDKINEGISSYKPLKYRWEKKVINKVTWINDAYNANPLSMSSSIEAFSKIKSKRKCVVIGTMHELGKFTQTEHIKLFKYVDSFDFDMWIVIGDWDIDIFDFKKGKCFKNIETASEFLNDWTNPDDYIFIKASRSEKFEEFLNN